MLDGAARHAASRGAPEEAATLAEQATRLTPSDRPGSARERMVHAVDYHFRAGDIARSRELIESAPSLVRGLVLKWCDRLDEARARLADRYRHALDRGEEASLPFLLYHFSELECWAGHWDTAEEYALEACRVAEEGRQHTTRPATLYSLALVRAHRGQVQQARELASQALALCDRTGNVLARSMVLSVLGFIAVSLDDAQDAHAHLGRLADVAAGTGLGEPSVVKFLPDEIEALAALGEVDLAWAFTRQLED